MLETSSGDEEEEEEEVTRPKVKGTRGRGKARAKRNAQDSQDGEEEEEGDDQEEEDGEPKAKRRKTATTTKRGSAAQDKSSVPSTSTSNPQDQSMTDADTSRAVDEEQDAEGEIDADGVADDDTEMKEEENDEESEQIVTRGRRTRASQGLRGPASASPTKSTKGKGSARGKKANEGVSKPEDEITPEKRGAIEGQEVTDSKSVEQATEDREDGEKQMSVAESIEIIRQEAPKPQSRGNGWYRPPPRVAEASKKTDDPEQEQQRQQQISEDMKRGGAGFSLSDGDSSSTTAATFALPRPPHLASLPGTSSPAPPSSEPVRSASQPPLTQQHDPILPSDSSRVTPPAIHHPQDAPNPYFSDPGKERPLYHSPGEEPAPPRPYIHPAHSVPSDSFVPGITPQTNETQQPIKHYPVPVSNEGEHEERKSEEAGARESHEVEGAEDGKEEGEEFEAEYARLEALVAEGEGPSRAGSGSQEDGGEPQTTQPPQQEQQDDGGEGDAVAGPAVPNAEETA
jgi:hypothetical protein